MIKRVIFMFNLIYLVLGIYLTKVIVIRINMRHKKQKNQKVIRRIFTRKNIEGKIKSIFNKEKQELYKRCLRLFSYSFLP